MAEKAETSAAGILTEMRRVGGLPAIGGGAQLPLENLLELIWEVCRGLPGSGSGFDGKAEDLTTTDVNMTHVLKPTGTGGVAFGAVPGVGDLKQSTVYTRTFLMVDSADHITGKTGLAPVVTISKAGAAFAAAAGVVSEIGVGWYKVALTIVDTNTLGDLAYHAAVAGADPSDFRDRVTV